jgi:hypothetical protein
MRALIGWTIVAITVLSLWWTTIKARRLLSRALGRRLRKGEETSLRSWMQASNAALDHANRELDRNPFDRLLRWLAALGFKEDPGTAPEERPKLNRG